MSSLGGCGRFELLRRVDVGGMGEIYLARGTVGADGRERYVAIKRLLPQVAKDGTFVTMFEDEARLALKLQHPAICRVWELGEQGGTKFLVMEWIDGVSLQALQRRAAARADGLPFDVTARIGLDVAAALDYAHRLTDASGAPLGIVHRDVSPRNIMIDWHGRVKLLDFGLAKARTHLHETQPGYVKGKFGYLAPEQLSGDVDARTDVFALGICLYEALTDEKIFDRPRAAETVRAVMAYERAPSLHKFRPDAGEALDRVVRTALAPNAVDRFRSAGKLGDELERAMGAEGVRPAGAERLGAFVQELFPEDARKRISERPPAAPHTDAAPASASTRDVPEHDVAADVDGAVERMRRSRNARGIALSVLALAVAVGAWLAWSSGW